MAIKPTNLLIAEAKNDIINAINKTGLPISVLDMIISQVALEIAQQNALVLEQEARQYREALDEEAAEKEKDNKVPTEE